MEALGGGVVSYERGTPVRTETNMAIVYRGQTAVEKRRAAVMLVSVRSQRIAGVGNRHVVGFGNKRVVGFGSCWFRSVIHAIILHARQLIQFVSWAGGGREATSGTEGQGVG